MSDDEIGDALCRRPPAPPPPPFQAGERSTGLPRTSGFGTSTTPSSKVWFTLEGGEWTEVYYPRIDTPSYRDLQFAITDGHSFVEIERDSTSQRTILLDHRSLIYRHVASPSMHGRGAWGERRLVRTTSCGRATCTRSRPR